MKYVGDIISEWLSRPDNNWIEPGSDRPAFDPPLVGVASGADELFSYIKNDIGRDFYWSPAEAFSAAYQNETVKPSELTVISWILPQTEHTRKAHRKTKQLPSIEWSKARHYGEKVNEALRRYLVELFTGAGIQACAPVMLDGWSRHLSPKYGFASSWSERHTAHVCGLGTFGISDGLITPKGKAIRVGSVIVRQVFEAPPRTYNKHNEWCLYQATGKCLVCARRCPAGAISDKGHDKEKCKAYIRNVTATHVEQEQLGFRVNSCGFCQTGVPCENRNPAARLKTKGVGK